MANAPQTYDNIKSVPLYVQFSWRGQNTGTVQADAWAKNVFLGKDGDGEGPYSVKRPGLLNAGNTTASGYANLAVQGMCVEYAPAPNPEYSSLTSLSGAYAPAVVVNDHLMNPLTGASNFPSLPIVGGIPLATATLGATPQPAGAWYTSTTVQVPELISHTGTGYTFCILQSAYGVHYGQYGWGVGPHWFEAMSYVAPNPAAGGTYSSGTFVPGIVSLDNTWYVLDTGSTIWASAIGDVSTWPILNSVKTDSIIGPAVALGKLGAYVIAFGQTGLQMFYDAGISPGAPIAAVQGGILLDGMAIQAPFSLASSETSLIWLASSASGYYSIKQLQGNAVGKISTSAVERYLNATMAGVTAPSTLAASVMVRGSVFRSAGHEFYMLTIQLPGASAVGTAGTTLVYDLETGAWVVWSQQTTLPYGEGGFRAWGALSMPGGVTYFPDAANGVTYQLSESAYQDNGQAINVLIQTDLWNWGNQRVKLIPATYPLLDTVNSTVYLSWTDNDYATFSTPQPIATLTAKKQLVRCGSTVQRAWQLTHTDNTPMRFYALEVEVIPGAL